MTAPLINPEDLSPTRAALLPASCSVLFLDVDGVLNRCGKSYARLESGLIDNLVRIVDETDCRIVVSSTWRWMPGPMAELTKALEDRGIAILSSTPVHQIRTQGGIYTASVRGDEIQAWMDEHGTPERFCIVDDDGDMAHLTDKLIKTSSFDGLTDSHADRIIAALNHLLNDTRPVIN